jgi:hypothetical protein
MKMNVNIFSSNQLEKLEVPINELDHAKANANANVIIQAFFPTGTLFFEMAIVNPIIFIINCYLRTNIQLR